MKTQPGQEVCISIKREVLKEYLKITAFLVIFLSVLLDECVDKIHYIWVVLHFIQGWIQQSGWMGKNDPQNATRKGKHPYLISKKDILKLN